MILTCPSSRVSREGHVLIEGNIPIVSTLMLIRQHSSCKYTYAYQGLGEKPFLLVSPHTSLLKQ